jgi:23S rRNA (pseudouridine1915-N3)-methyltransferase
MFKATIIAVGQMKPSPEKDLFDKYQIRLPQQLVLKEVQPSHHTSRNKEKETLALIKALPQDAVCIVLDEKGKQMSTLELAHFIEAKQKIFGPHFAFLIGGADGMDVECLPKDASHLSLGRLTWPHMLVRGLIAEQIYRVVTILNGHPYHRQ